MVNNTTKSACPHCGSPMQRWSAPIFDLLRLYTANNKVARYANDDGSTLEEDIEFLALARVSENLVDGCSEFNCRSRHGTTTINEPPYRMIVAVTLSNGHFEVANEAANFIGVFKKGSGGNDPKEP